jgi:hypothetical protein
MNDWIFRVQPLEYYSMQEETLPSRRKGQRRRYRPVPLFPMHDIAGTVIMAERRHMPDRREADVSFDVAEFSVYIKEVLKRQQA